MIISKTPLRISYAGGGTDFYDYYCKSSSIVFNTTIDKYIYVTLTKKFNTNEVNVRYSKTEVVENINSLEHGIAREALKMFDVSSGVEITIISDIPARGSGLGSSSALAVGLINCLYAFTHRGEVVNPYVLAELACELEISKLKSPIGKQDQYAASFGGFNRFEFFSDKTIVTPVVSKKIMGLERNTLLYYLDMPRDACDVLKEHKNNIDGKRHLLDELRYESEMVDRWFHHSGGLVSISNVLNMSWKLKKEMSRKSTNLKIDSLITLLTKHKTIGVKLCGAGGGGFLMVVCDNEDRDFVMNCMKHYQLMEFFFSGKGSEVIYDDRQYFD